MKGIRKIGCVLSGQMIIYNEIYRKNKFDIKKSLKNKEAFQD